MLSFSQTLVATHVVSRRSLLRLWHLLPPGVLSVAILLQTVWHHQLPSISTQLLLALEWFEFKEPIPNIDKLKILAMSHRRKAAAPLSTEAEWDLGWRRGPSTPPGAWPRHVTPTPGSGRIRQGHAGPSASWPKRPPVLARHAITFLWLGRVSLESCAASSVAVSNATTGWPSSGLWR